MARARNGRSGAGTLRRMPVRTMHLQLEGDYAEFSVEMRSNPPMRVFTDMQDNSDFTLLRDRIRELIIDWDFVDDQGGAIPVGDVEAIPIDLFSMIISTYLNGITAAAAVPKV